MGKKPSHATVPLMNKTSMAYHSKFSAEFTNPWNLMSSLCT